MKAHLMEVHHEVFQGDPDWLDLLVDDENKKNLKMVNRSFRISDNEFLAIQGRC